MLAGRTPFARATLTDTLAAIVDRDPCWDALPRSTPPTIRRLLRRCLEKDPKQRLRDIGDAWVEIDDSRTAAAPTAEVTSSRKSARVPWLVATAASIVALLSIASAWLFPAAPVEIPSPRFSRIVPVTTGPARELGPDISPDGKWVAYVSNLDGQPDVWVKFLAGGEAANLTAAAGIDVSSNTGIGGLDISPDGTRIAVMAKTRGSTGPFATWEIPAPLPGVPRKLLDDGLVGMRWALNGRQITFIRAGAAAGDALWVADGDGTNRREIVPASDGLHIHWPTWSRDGFIYFIRTNTTIANLDRAEIYRVDSRGGEPSPVVTTLRRAMYPVLTPGGDGLIYAANPVGVELGLWWRAIGGGDPQRLSFGTGDYAEPRISGDGRTLVATRYELRQSLARVALTPAEFGRITTVTDGYGGDLDPSISPSGGRVVFSSSRTGARHLWTVRLDGADMRPLTSGSALDDRPAFSPDGSQIAFNSDREGRRGIWIIGTEGGTPRRVGDVSATGALSWSPDGKRVVYAAGAGGWPGLWSVSVDNGQVQRIATPGAVSEPVWHPTRDLIAYMEPATSGPGYTRLSFVDSAGQPQYKTLPPAPAISTGFSNGMPAWSPDGRRLAVVSQNANAAASIWIVDPESATPFRKLVELPVGPRIRGLAWARDGSALVIGQHDTTSDIVLLDQGQ
jgi:Tol biopolymer transport system component